MVTAPPQDQREGGTVIADMTLSRPVPSRFADRPVTARVIVLGAGRAASSRLPAAVVDVDQGSRVLDWQLAAFTSLGSPEVWFVAGFRADEVAASYPGLRTVLNREWATTGAAHSLALVPHDEPRTTYVCYSDVVFRAGTVEALQAAEGDVVLAVDTRWKVRYDARSRSDLDRAEKVQLGADTVLAIGPDVSTASADAEFAGVARLDALAAAAASQAMADGSLPATATIPDLIEYLRGAGLHVTTVDVCGDWAELNAPQDLARFVLGTKAESLARLRARVKHARIGHLVVSTAQEWHDAPQQVMDRILHELSDPRLIVRSSAVGEDGWDESGAGAHTSVPDVPRDRIALGDAIARVLASYTTVDPAHQVLVQGMVADVSVSGVVMTRTHATGGPYYVINFDDRTGSTATVTSGADARTVFVHRDALDAQEWLPAGVPSSLTAVLQAVREVESLVGHDSLDVEFALTRDHHVHLFQVRPIATAYTAPPVGDDAVRAALDDARARLAQWAQPTPSVVGTRTAYSVMADWNPAEIIGVTPKRLARSLYRTLVTDEVWARQRAEYGYRDVRPCPLLVEIAGHPYVDVRASFNSFVPASIDENLAARLVDHGIDLLARRPHLHDKVEFEVVSTCLTLDFDERARDLHAAGFSAHEVSTLRDALRLLTTAAPTRVDAELAGLDAIVARTDRIDGGHLAPLDKAFALLDVARRHGTPAFAHLARSAFVATSLLRSAVTTGVITGDEQDAFLADVETVLGRMRRDGHRVAAGTLPWDAFVAAYGHLRPGTYDITSPCYAQAPDAYLGPLVVAAPDGPTHPSPRWGHATRTRLAAALGRAGLPDDAVAFERFVARAIFGREEAKFVFTRALSRALEHLAVFGSAHGLSRDDLAHLHIDDLMACRDALADPYGFLVRRVSEGRDAFALAQAVSLPGLLLDETGLRAFEQQAAEPNFVTQQSVEAPVVAQGLGPDTPIDGTIVAIPHADPGYDWLLARPIAGLVTMYGGSNSHMAVRAAERQLPAAIGVGELRYAALASATRVRLDCASRTITVVR